MILTLSLSDSVIHPYGNCECLMVPLPDSISCQALRSFDGRRISWQYPSLVAFGINCCFTLKHLCYGNSRERRIFLWFS